MLRVTSIVFILFVSLPLYSTYIWDSNENDYCQVIKDFECKCSEHRATCTNDDVFTAPIKILQNQKYKYQSIVLTISSVQNIQVNDRTFEPINKLYKRDANALEFRVKFEKFTALNLTSPSIFNRVFPDDLSSNTRKHFALEIYNPDVAQDDNPYLFNNLDADSLEMYGLYPFRGTFQQIFNGSNIKYLRVSGGEIHSDFSQSFNGIIHRFELAKQADVINAHNFPVYPAHEMIINAYYVTKFNNENPPNYKNLVELRVHTPENIPANAFIQYPNIHTLSLQFEKDVNPYAFDGLNNLEKLVIKDTKIDLNHLNKLPALKELEIDIEKFDSITQCELIEKVANGQLAVLVRSTDPQCTCINAYLNATLDEISCGVNNCENLSCAAIRNNYNARKHTFEIPPPLQRSDGTNAFRERKPNIYTTPYQIPEEDRQKLINNQQPEEHHDSTDQPENDNDDDHSTISCPLDSDEDNPTPRKTVDLDQIRMYVNIIQRYANNIEQLLQIDD